MSVAVEYSKSSAALCKNPECKCSSRHISKGSIRFKVNDLGGFTHFECLPVDPKFAPKDLTGFRNLSAQDQYKVKVLLDQQNTKKDFDQTITPDLAEDPFLPLLQRVLLSATKATEVVSLQGKHAGYAFLLKSLQQICASKPGGHQNVLGSPVPQVSLEGSTPHTVSTISSDGTAQSRGSQSQSSTHRATPAQTSSLHADIVGTHSASASLCQEERTHLLSSPPPQITPAAPELTCAASVDAPVLLQEALNDVSVETALSDAVETPSVPLPLSPQVLPPIPEEGPALQESAITASDVPPPPLSSPPPPVLPTQHRKHARVIEAATMPVDYHTGQQSSSREHSPLPTSSATAIDTTASDTSYVTATTITSTRVFRSRFEEMKAREQVGARYRPSNASASASAVGLGSPAPVQRKALAERHLNRLLPTAQVAAARAPNLSMTVPGASGAVLPSTSSRVAPAVSTSSSHATSSASTTVQAAAAGATPQLHELRQLLRASNEQRRQASRQPVPRFNSATAAHLAQQAQQAQQQVQQESRL